MFSSSPSNMLTTLTLLLLTTLTPSTTSHPVPDSHPLDPRSSSDLLPRLFPSGGYPSDSAWTTSTSLPARFNLHEGIPLRKGKKPTNGHSPDGKGSIVAYFPKGSINPGNKDAPNGGLSFYSNGPDKGKSVTKGQGAWQGDLNAAMEVSFAYSVWFEHGFEFNKGGKMPGVYGGTSEELAMGCSGGRQEGRDDCFSSRLMWRTNSAGEAYNYFPTSVQQPAGYCEMGPMSECNPQYGDSIGRGSFGFDTGRWVTVAQRIKLNDVGQANGQLEIFVDGESKLNLSGLILRTKGDSVFRGIQVQTFFGGHKTEWASPKDQTAWFKDWSLAILA